MNTIDSDPDSTDSSEQKTEQIWAKLINKESTTVFNLTAEHTRVGRDEEVMIDDRAVSRTHCTISKRQTTSQTHKITDTSSNGTYIDGNRITKGTKCSIRNAQTVSFGSKQKQNTYVFVANESCIFHYNIHETVGKGAFGVVKRATRWDNTQHTAAIKCIKRTNIRDDILKESSLLKSLDHPNIIRCYGVYLDTESVHLALEFADDGVVKPPYAQTVCDTIAAQLLSALRYLHGKEIVHRDVKPDNILVTNKWRHIVKLTDFGLSRMVTKEKLLKTICGSPIYVAPEVLKCKTDGPYTKKCDIWSLGIVLYVMLVQSHPYTDAEKNNKNIMRECAEGNVKYSNEFKTKASSKYFTMVRGMLEVDPKKRLEIDQCEVMNQQGSKPTHNEPTSKTNKRKRRKRDDEDEDESDADDNEPKRKKRRIAMNQ